MFRSWMLVTIVLACASVAALSIVFPRLRGATPASAVTQTPFEMYLDCAPGGAIDDACSLPSGTPSFDIDVVLKNNSGAAVSISAFNFTIVDDNKQNFAPVVPASCLAPGLDCNPDFNQAGVLGAMNCSPPLPSPDVNLDGLVNTAESTLSCNTGLPATPYLADGSSVVLATVHYTSIDGFADFAIRNAELYDDSFGELMTCNPVITTQGNCFPANMDIGAVGTNTPTATPTQTATPTATPTAIPNGAVTDVLAINEGSCILGGAQFGIPVLKVLTDCQGMTFQSSLQELVHCLRGYDLFDDGVFDCLIPDPNVSPADPSYPLRSDVVLSPVAADFAPLEHDADQFHFGIAMEIVAFVEGDYPVLFETDRGEFTTFTQPDSASYLCSTKIQDPDCDAISPVDGDSTTSNDHVVATRLRLTDDTRGDMHVTVTQNGHSVVKTIHVVGPPATISVEAINGKDTIETGATAPTAHGDVPLDTACDFPGEQEALSGISSPKKTVLLTKALDSEGHEVVGALINWDHPFVPSSILGDPAPQGGVFFPQQPILDLGAAGIGYPQIVCGGTEPGDFVSTLTFNGTIDVPADPNYSRTFTVHVVDTLPSPSCAGDVDGSGAVNSIDLQLVAAHFGHSFVNDPDYDILYDFNGDGVINSIDLMLTAQHFGPCLD